MDDCENCFYKYSCELREIKEPEDKCDDFSSFQSNIKRDENYENAFFLYIPIHEQTLAVGIGQYNATMDGRYFSIVADVYTKRRDRVKNMDGIITTGIYPAFTLAALITAFKELEYYVLKRYNRYEDVTIAVTWSDNKRRDIYYRYLKRLGYNYCYDRNKYIGKKVKKGSVIIND